MSDEQNRKRYKNYIKNERKRRLLGVDILELKVQTTGKGNKLVLSDDLHAFLKPNCNLDKWNKNICKSLNEGKDYAIKSNKIIFKHDIALKIIEEHVIDLSKNIAYWSEQHQEAIMKVTKNNYKSLINLTEKNINGIKKSS